MSVHSQLFNLNAVPIVQSDDTVLNLVGIIVTAPGALVIKNGKGETVTITVGATSVEPVTIWTNITRVMAATAQADGALTGLTLA